MAVDSRIIQFVRAGVVGDLRLGMTRAEVTRKLGIPKEWGGKPPTFGPAVLSPEKADNWSYYGRTVVSFDPKAVIVCITVFPREIEKDKEPFLSLPIGPRMRMKDFRDLLIENGLDFEEGEDNEPGGYYIIAEARCVAMGVPYAGGRLVPELNREILAIETVASENELPSFVSRQHKRKFIRY